ncbi:flagellar biosynthetic protein FliR [Acidisoma silvae]|uniref:Flagellar biosynthetic protein FliR n=2 Tax=Acidisoma silvae TaxID=2802396 RepID=A0A963YQF2_9PROT|nr:flagellar biosynthetic protein FliR [Acidisoma silvae]
MAPNLVAGDIFAWAGRVLWPLLRLTGLFLTAPLYSSSFIPARVKAVFVLAYAWALSLWLPHLPPFPDIPAVVLAQTVTQISTGAAIGLTAQLVVSAVASIGEIAGLSIGLSFATLQFRDTAGNTETLYDLMFWLGLVGYVSLGGPLWLFAAVAHSFQGGGLTPLSAQSWGDLAAFGGVVVNAGVMLALPVMAVALCINLTVGLMTVFAPQLNLLTIGFPLLILGGLTMLSASVLFMNGAIQALLDDAARMVARMITHV